MLKKTVVGILSILLTACGGSGSTSAPASTSNPSTLAPLSGGKTYNGTLSFGDTVKIELDQPSTGSVRLTFVDSQFGLSGSVVGPYTRNGNSYTLNQGFSQQIGSSLSTAQAGAMVASLVLTEDSVGGVGTLSGSVGNLPNLKVGGGLLQGKLAATNNGVTSVADLAGVYSVVKLSGNYSVGGVPTGSQDPTAGQLKINADGTVRVCYGAAYSDTCTNFDSETKTQTVATAALTIEADQTRFPGALTLSDSKGNRFGRLFVSRQGGTTTAFLDQAGVNADGTFRTGSWVMTAAKSLTSSDYDGPWTCSEPAVSNTNVILGTTNTTRVTFRGNTLTPSNPAATVALTYNATFGGVVKENISDMLVNGVNGIIAGVFSGTNLPTSAIAFMPVSKSTMYYLSEVNGNGFFVMGVCNK